jgi:AAA+ ATPase superfamily predicted ATPase
MPEINTFVGRIFEDVALSEISLDKKYNDYFFGRWWDNEHEADIVGIDREHKKILIAEVKFKKLTEREIKDITYKLKEKAARINTFTFEEHLIIICLGGDDKAEKIEIITVQ